MAENITARCAESLKLDSVEDAWVNGMFHNVCGPVNVGILKRELGEKAKMEGGLTFCNMFIKATGKNWVTPAYEFPFNYLEDKTYVEYEPVCSDTNERFIRDYRFDVSKLEPSAAKRKKVEVPTYLTQITHKAWMDTDIASKSPDQVERFVPRYLRKLGVILLPVLVELLAWVSLETLTLTLLHLRSVAIPLSQTGAFPGRMGHKKPQIYSPYIAAASAFTHLVCHSDGCRVLQAGSRNMLPPAWS
ncbi:3-isopropylmalate dehydratase large subunit, chloroplastic isoform X3 [Dendrobium catenatum]|uniref:3-isopropylmalate dehydratase large subunit, chloroplastic isoform X3 n=1 Tax=Dendrobium catenatum TaxID=906689 RepID=UPI0009F7113E|nr:3-isopropylmalate dehydratase large subunit, chloroplastic isoform X3 [Dendrobium catenatum]